MAKPKPEVKYDPHKRTYYVELRDQKDQQIAEGFGWAVHIMDGKGVVYPEHPDSEQEAQAIADKIAFVRGHASECESAGRRCNA